MLWALRPVSQNAWGHGRQTLSAVEKLPQKSVTNKERKRKEVCLPLNEAKNGKRVWCRSGTQPAFPKWGRLNFPTSSQARPLSKQLPPRPPAPEHCAFILWHGRPRLHPASITGLQPSRLLWTTGKEEEKWGKGKHPAVPLDLWASPAKLKRQEQNRSIR